MHKHSMPHMIIALLLSLLVGMLAPWLWLLTITQVVYFLPLLICFVAVWAGPIPAAVMGVTLIVGGLMGGGMPVAIGAAMLVILPSAVNYWALEKRLPFFKALKIAIAAQLGCMLALAAGLYLYTRMDLVDILTGNLRRFADTLPVTVQNRTIQALAQQGMIGENYRTLHPALINTTQRAMLFNQVAALLNEWLRLSLPGTALCGSVLGALLTVTLPRYWCVRRGVEPQVQYVPLTQWRVPLDVAAGVLGCLVVTYAVESLGIIAVVGASATMLSLLLTVLQIHGAAALMRMLKQNGVGQGMRMLLLVIGLMPGMYILYLGGVYSLLFGSHGAVPAIQKKMRNKEGDDE